MRDGDFVRFKDEEEIKYVIIMVNDNEAKLQIIKQSGNTPSYATGIYNKKIIEEFGVIIPQHTTWKERYEGEKHDRI